MPAGPAAKASSPSTAATVTSRQPSFSVRVNWRTGSASNSSLPRMKSGRSGRLSTDACHVGRLAKVSSARFWISVRRGLASISAMSIRSRKPGSSRTKGAQHVGHQRAATGADLGQRGRQRRPCRAPGLVDPDRDELAEHLAHLGRGDEVAPGAEGLAGRVVAVRRVEQAGGHVVGNGDRPGRFDQPDQLFLQRRHCAGSATVRGFAVAIAQMPAATIGADRSMPMVSQPPSR